MKGESSTGPNEEGVPLFFCGFCVAQIGFAQPFVDGSAIMTLCGQQRIQPFVSTSDCLISPPAMATRGSFPRASRRRASWSDFASVIAKCFRNSLCALS